MNNFNFQNLKLSEIHVKLSLWLIEQKRKIDQNFLFQGPGYAKIPLGHRVAYPT